MRKHTTVSIPIALYKKIERKIKNTGFASVSEWVTYVLREIIAGLEKEGKVTYTKEEEEKVKERLRALGYL